MARKTILQKSVMAMLPSEAELRVAKKPDLWDFDRDAHLQDLEAQASRAGSYSALDCIRVIKAEPFSIDAYTMLAAVESLGYENRIAILQRGILASTIFLGPEFMTEERGSFYSLLETRPHIRAMGNLMQLHVEFGSEDTAVDVGLEIMRLNTHDNLGVRSPVFTMLMEKGDLDRARDILNAYPDDTMPGLTFGSALLAFMEERTEDATQAIKRADMFQGYVVRGLLGKKLKSDALPYGIPCGGSSEAMTYVEEAKELWKKTPGALDFLKAYAKSRPEDWDRKAALRDMAMNAPRPNEDDELRF